MNPWFLVVFFGIFQLLGGGAFGRGVRALFTEPEQAKSLLVSGAMFGILPMLFEWLMFMQPGQLIYRLSGPTLFIVVAVVSALAGHAVIERFDPKAIVVMGIGSAAVALGILAIPFMLGQTQGRDIGSMDYVLGGCWVLMFVVIGSGFALTGLNALLHERTFDEEVAVSQQAVQAPGRKSQAKRGGDEKAGRGSK